MKRIPHYKLKWLGIVWLFCFFPLQNHAQKSDKRALILVKKASELRKENGNFASQYSYEVYTRSALRFAEYFPFDTLLNRTLFQVIKPEKEPQDRKRNKRPPWMPPDLDSEILYLSENVSDIYIPNKVKEVIKTSRVSGELTRFSFAGGLLSRYDPYKKRYPIPAVCDYGLISPLAPKAAFFYHFRLIDSSSNRYSISFQSKRKYENTFHGEFQLDKESLSITSLSFWTSKVYGIDRLDSLNIKQQYIQEESGKWVPELTEIRAKFDLDLLWIKVPFVGYAMSQKSDFRERKEIPKKFWDSEIIRVNTHMTDQGNAELDSIRPIPLDRMERFDYTLKDSLRSYRNSVNYLDSLTKNQNWITISNVILLGTQRKNYRLKTVFSAEQLLSSVGFNPMEGWFIQPNLSFEKTYASDQKLEINLRGRYAFGIQKLGYLLAVNYKSRPRNLEYVRAAGGDYIAEFSRFSQVGFFSNTQATLLEKESLMRLYRKQFWEVGYQREIINGLSASFDLRFENRSQMQNVSDFSFRKDSLPYEENFRLENHQAMIAELNIRYTPFSKFIGSPTAKFNLGSTWPTFELNFQQSLAGVTNHAADFSKIRLSIFKELSFGFLWNNQWRVSLGGFL